MPEDADEEFLPEYLKALEACRTFAEIMVRDHPDMAFSGDADEAPYERMCIEILPALFRGILLREQQRKNRLDALNDTQYDDDTPYWQQTSLNANDALEAHKRGLSSDMTDKQEESFIHGYQMAAYELEETIHALQEQLERK